MITNRITPEISYKDIIVYIPLIQINRKIFINPDNGIVLRAGEEYKTNVRVSKIKGKVKYVDYKEKLLVRVHKHTYTNKILFEVYGGFRCFKTLERVNELEAYLKKKYGALVHLYECIIPKDTLVYRGIDNEILISNIIKIGG